MGFLIDASSERLGVLVPQGGAAQLRRKLCSYGRSLGACVVVGAIFAGRSHPADREKEETLC